MKRCLGLTVAALVGLATPAAAADMPIAPAPVVTGYNWTGWQFGFGAGGSWNDSRFDSVGVAPATTVGMEWDQVRLSLHGLHQYQFSNFGWGSLVLGVQYAMDFPVDSTVGLSVCPNPAFGCETTIGTMLTAGGRIGLGFNHFLVYATGGLAKGEIDTRFILGGVSNSPDTKWTNGYYLGGGFDWLVHRGNGIDLLLGAEYQHIDLGTERHFAPGGVVVAGFTRDVRVTQDIIKGKLSIKFNGPSFW